MTSGIAIGIFALYFLFNQKFVVQSDDRIFCEPIIEGYATPSVYVPGFATIIGSTTVSYWSKRKIHQYLGIPFAEPPIGNLRFKPPDRKKWSLVDKYNGTYFRGKCPQLATEQDVQNFADAQHPIEDCLHLNVFVPDITERSEQIDNLPVMVYIHGGGFYQGSAQDFCPNYLLEKNVILVTIQYRLGPLGFLNLQIDEVPGNMGFMDQVLALEWVNENIRYFSGDNNKVTIFGSSAGAASVSLMLVSPLVKPGLFQQAIMHSGNILCDWVYDSNPVSHAEIFARLLNCSDTNLHLLADCLLNIPPFELIKMQKYYMGKLLETGKRSIIKESSIALASVQLAGSRKFLIENPKLSFKAGRYRRVPVIAGVTENEGSFIVAVLYEALWNPYKNNSCFTDKNGCLDNEYLKNDIYNDYLQFLGYDADETPIIELSKDVYFPNDVRGNFLKMVPGLIDVCSDLIMKLPTMSFARKLHKEIPTYLYSFNYKGRQTKLGYGKPIDLPFDGGVAHSDDLIYLFPHPNNTFNEDESNVANTMVELWTNFAASNSSDSVLYGHGVTWKSMSSRSGPFLKIDKVPTVQNDFLQEYAALMKQNRQNAVKNGSPLLLMNIFSNLLLLSICTFWITLMPIGI